MAVKTTDTYAEWLQKVLQLVQQGKMMQDALPHLEFITDLETTVLQELHAPVDAAQPNSQVPVPPPGSVPMPPPGAGGPGMPPGGAMPPQVPGVSQSPNRAPAVDELRRILAAGG